MVHLSKVKVENKKLNKVFSLFFEIVKSTHDETDFLELIKDVISPLEQIMIAKRITIIYLIMKGVPTISIVDYLKVSSSTVAKFTLLFSGKETTLVLKIRDLLKKEKITHFFDDLFADLFIQPGIRKGHFQLYWEHKRRQKERKMLDG